MALSICILCIHKRKGYVGVTEWKRDYRGAVSLLRAVFIELCCFLHIENRRLHIVQPRNPG